MPGNSHPERVSAPTLADVAAAAGVSPAAASLALRGRRGVGDETRQRVRLEAEALGYKARAKRSHAYGIRLGVLLKSQEGDEQSTNAFYGPVVGGITEACEHAKYDAILGQLPVDERFEPVEIPRVASEERSDGLLILGAFLSRATASIIGMRPMVLVDGYAAEPSRYTSVVNDNESGARTGVQYLIGLGHRRILLAGSEPSSFPSILGRRRGYISAVTDADMPVLTVDGDHADPDRCASLAADAIERDPSITAVFAANDTVAMACFSEFRRRRIQVPEDISVMGFDDVDAAAHVEPGLTTLAVDKPAMGRLAVRALQHQLDHPQEPPFTVMLHPTLVVRDSVGPPKTTAR